MKDIVARALIYSTLYHYMGLILNQISKKSGTQTRQLAKVVLLAKEHSKLIWR